MKKNGLKCECGYRVTITPVIDRVMKPVKLSWLVGLAYSTSHRLDHTRDEQSCPYRCVCYVVECVSPCHGRDKEHGKHKRVCMSNVCVHSSGHVPWPGHD